MPHVQRVWQENHRVYGADKVWRPLNREGVMVARCPVERLMRAQGLQGVRRGKRLRTTIADDAASRPMDRVNRQFRAERRAATTPRRSLVLPALPSALRRQGRHT